MTENMTVNGVTAVVTDSIAIKSIADVMKAVVTNPIPITPRRTKTIEKVDLNKVDVKRFRVDYPSSNAGLIALLLSRPTTRHELLGFLLAVYYGGDMKQLKVAKSRLNGFLATPHPRKSVTVTNANGSYTAKNS